MKTAKKLKDLFKIAEGRQLTAQAVLNERIYAKDFKLSDELREQIANDVSDVLGGHASTKNAVFNSLNASRPPQHWGLNRILLDDYGRGPRWTYCAGQDYPAELNQIRNHLKKL